MAVGAGLLYSLRDVTVIKYILYLEPIIMASSNFNHYNRDDFNNFDGLNMITTVFSVIFAIFNTYLANCVIYNIYVKTIMTSVVLFIELFSIIFTNFKFETMDTFTMKQLIIALVFAIIMVPKFNQINNAIVNESITEAKLSYEERDCYKRMFDGLQEGIIVSNENNVTFMN